MSLLASLADNRLSMLRPFFFTDPKLVECTKAGQDTSPEPTAVAAFHRVSRRVDFDVWETPSKFGGKAVSKPSKQTSTASKNNVTDEDLA